MSSAKSQNNKKAKKTHRQRRLEESFLLILPSQKRDFSWKTKRRLQTMAIRSWIRWLLPVLPPWISWLVWVGLGWLANLQRRSQVLQFPAKPNLIKNGQSRCALSSLCTKWQVNLTSCSLAMSTLMETTGGRHQRLKAGIEFWSMASGKTFKKLTKSLIESPFYTKKIFALKPIQFRT